PLVQELRPAEPLKAHHPLSPVWVCTATSRPAVSPEGVGTAVAKGSRKRSHTRRYHSRCGQLDDSRTTIRRVLTITKRYRIRLGIVATRVLSSWAVPGERKKT